MAGDRPKSVAGGGKSQASSWRGRIKASESCTLAAAGTINPNWSLVVMSKRFDNLFQ
jgi:hypothetical protein